MLPSTRHKWTSERAPPNPSRGRLVLDLPTPEGWKAELTWMIGYMPIWFTCQHAPIQVLTGPDEEQLRWSRPTCYHYTTPPWRIDTLRFCLEYEEIFKANRELKKSVSSYKYLLCFAVYKLRLAGVSCGLWPPKRLWPRRRRRARRAGMKVRRIGGWLWFLRGITRSLNRYSPGKGQRSNI